MYTGPHIIKDGLVFGYDTGYGIADNVTGTRFYPGKPTENLFATTAMEFKSDNPSYTSAITNGTDSIGNYFIKDTSNAPWWSGLRIYNNSVRPLTAGVSYVLSFECRSPQSGWSWSGDANASGGGWSGNDSGRLSNTNTVFDSTGSTTYTEAMVNTWQRVSFRVTMKDSSVFTGASAYPHDSFFTTTNNVKIYYRNAQLEIGKTTATPFVNGTRSNTASLIDLKGTASIDVSNVSFDSTGQPEFDGTDDYFTTSGLTTNSPTSVSFETIIKFDGTLDSNDRKVFHWDKTNTSDGVAQIRKGNNNGRLMYQHHNGTSWYTLSVDSVVTSDTYIHILLVHSGTTATMYKNGVQVGTTTVSNLEYTNAGEILIGYRTSSEYWKGEIPIFKVYNKALTATEVKQNYNAYKNRFDI
jgi:hypothetical protein